MVRQLRRRTIRKRERENPDIISGSRRKRISLGSGTDVQMINKLLKQFKMMSKMMKKMSKGGVPKDGVPPELFNQLKWKKGKNVKNKTIDDWGKKQTNI